MQSNVAVLTMVRDDAFFLRKWTEYYGALFGRENLYVVNHGRENLVRELAWGCNVIGIPGDAHKNFDAKRWRLLNGIMAGLRSYYTHVICGDVDEIVVMDPRVGCDLAEFMRADAGGGVLTPFGIEVVHLRNLESQPVENDILGPRRHVRQATHYAKPCIVGTNTKLSRGGHYSHFDKLQVPQDMYLLHLKFCDYDLFRSAMDRRNEMVREIGLSNPKDVMVGAHWFSQSRADEDIFAAFSKMPVSDAFDFSQAKAAMQKSWQPRGTDGMWHFQPQASDQLFRLPERFFGVI